jgi:hypothetical protein
MVPDKLWHRGITTPMADAKSLINGGSGQPKSNDLDLPGTVFSQVSSVRSMALQLQNCKIMKNKRLLIGTGCLVAFLYFAYREKPFLDFSNGMK